MLCIKFPGVNFTSEKLNMASLLKNSWILFEGKARGGKNSVLGYVSIFDDLSACDAQAGEQRSHRDIDLGTAVPTKDGVLQEALTENPLAVSGLGTIGIMIVTEYLPHLVQ
jgi:hypothetical protein